jgi:ABC-type long-subunit fatty acid transport system fused permease/ATPase subunit
VKRRDYYALMADVRRLRPVVVIVLTIVVLLPSFDEMVTQSLSPLTVLTRLAGSLAVIGLLVWAVSGVVLHYAGIQVRSQRHRDQESGTRA